MRRAVDGSKVSIPFAGEFRQKPISIFMLSKKNLKSADNSWERKGQTDRVVIQIPLVWLNPYFLQSLNPFNLFFFLEGIPDAPRNLLNEILLSCVWI